MAYFIVIGIALLGLAKFLDLETLIQKCIQKDPKAVREFYSAYSGKVMEICHRYSKDKAMVDDNFQESFIRIYNKLHLYDLKASNFEGWLYRIVVNVSLRGIQKEKKHISEDVDDYEYTIESDLKIDENIEYNELIEMIHSLPEEVAKVFNMYVVEGYSHQEIGETLGIPSGTSKSRLNRAKKQLKEILETRGYIS